jgi:hypothetical protein
MMSYDDFIRGTDRVFEMRAVVDANARVIEDQREFERLCAAWEKGDTITMSWAEDISARVGVKIVIDDGRGQTYPFVSLAVRRRDEGGYEVDFRPAKRGGIRVTNVVRSRRGTASIHHRFPVTEARHDRPRRPRR